MTLLSELYNLDEVVQPLPSDMDVEEMVHALEKRLGAAKRGLGFANRLRNPVQKKKHMASVLANLNSIRGQLNRVIKEMEQFAKASTEYETGISYPESTAQNNIQPEMPTANRQGSRAAFANT